MRKKLAIGITLLVIADSSLSASADYTYTAVNGSSTYLTDSFTTYQALAEDSDTSKTYQEGSSTPVSLGSSPRNAFSLADSQTSLASAPENSYDAVNLVGEVATVDLTTSLYYEGVDVTDSAVTSATTSDASTTVSTKTLYSSSWNVQSGFDTGVFTIAVTGSTGYVSQSLSIEISTEPFALLDNNGDQSDSVHGGAVAVYENESVSAWDKKVGESSVYESGIAELATNTYFDGYSDATVSSSTESGHASGNVDSFFFRISPASTTLPTGRYESRVVISYAIQ
ncbi:MAG: hypothetical protein LKE40_05960 [Spirochaetia bacterium]|jgi:hypothetical protein|nr:hypothetical protein [Spirochaetia bacterium]